MNILIVATHHDVFTQKIGAQHRIFNMALQLDYKGNDIHILQPDRFSSEKSPEFKCSHFKEHEIPFLKSIGWEYLPLFTDMNFSYIFRLRNLIKNENIELIQVEYPWGIIAAKLLIKLSRKNILLVYDSHDVEYKLIKQFVDKVLSKKSKIMQYLFYPGLFYIYLQERFATKCADHILTVSNDDKENFNHIYKTKLDKISVIPSGLNLKNLGSLENKNKTKEKFKIPNEKITVIFHGAYSHFPNKEAISHIKNYLAPDLKDLVFIIAGTGVPECRKGNLYSLGFVEDLESLLYASDIAIVPLISGGGTKIKILDYLNMGLPIVSTAKGMEGIDVNNYDEAIVVDDINENFISAIDFLAKNKDKREKIGLNARKLAKKFDWNKIGEKLNNLYFSLKSIRVLK